MGGHLKSIGRAQVGNASGLAGERPAQMSDFTIASALFSECGCYRYRRGATVGPLERSRWLPNAHSRQPPTPTAPIPRFADVSPLRKSWGFGGLVIGNLFALRSPKPRLIYECTDPVGPENDCYLRKIPESCERIVCGWGRHGAYLDRASGVCRMLTTSKLYALEVTAGWHPSHPLYISVAAEPKPFQISMISPAAPDQKAALSLG